MDLDKIGIQRFKELNWIYEYTINRLGFARPRLDVKHLIRFGWYKTETTDILIYNNILFILITVFLLIA